MLQGIDISRYQGVSVIDRYKPQFVMMKASEGLTIKDSHLDLFYNKIHGKNDGKPDPNKLYGFYHYAHPENNDMQREAQRFLSLVGHHAGHCIFALDWEGKALRYNADKALEWLRYVYDKTGVRPLFYTSASATGKYVKIFKENYGLWVAHYGAKKPAVRGWKTWAMWQFTSSPIDRDRFNGNEKTWRAYCKKTK